MDCLGAPYQITYAWRSWWFLIYPEVV
ncbi:hypothetical protein NC653_026909 [Populus alba x Populus x berolinensis]|uniref:Uncharacterized protein n=1 Tax=Populus alba x Populus x berolinensis TaxID=444605 RepID=A0AAD6M470_9ROSI|nr:hypothetical protein NC653_026909 [Populus alba x Populus x berolinensis]